MIVLRLNSAHINASVDARRAAAAASALISLGRRRAQTSRANFTAEKHPIL